MDLRTRIEDLPIVKTFITFLRAVKIPGLQGMSLYDLIDKYITGIIRGALTTRASGISYSFFMAIFPFLLFILTLIPYVPIENFQESFTIFIEQLLPPKTYDAVQGVIDDIINNRYGGLLSFGFLASMFLMANGVSAIFGSFEYTYHNIEIRSVWKSYIIAIAISLLLSVILISLVVVSILVEYVLERFSDSGFVEDYALWLNLGRGLLFFIAVFVSVAILYYFGTREGKKQHFLSPGAVMTTLLSFGTFYLFGIYIEKFSKYNELYGSIGTLLIIMLFIWLNSIILLLGYELNASMIDLRKKALSNRSSS